MRATARRPQNARPTSKQTASACATRTSAHKACRSVPGLSRQAAKQSLPCGSSRSACTGRRTGRRASRHCALASSAGATQTCGHGARNPSTQLRPDRNRPDPPCAIPRLTVPHLARTIPNGGLSHSLQTRETARKPANIREHQNRVVHPCNSHEFCIGLVYCWRDGHESGEGRLEHDSQPRSAAPGS